MRFGDKAGCRGTERRNLHRVVRPLAVAAAFVVATTAWAAPPRFLVTDLPDTTVGEDLWRYDYTLTGPIPAFAGLNIAFDADRYAALTLISLDPTVPLNVSLAQPDASIAFDGQVVVQALSPLDASFVGRVPVSFVWSGDGRPGQQPFEQRDNAFFITGSGFTVAVPEPDIAWLLFIGILALWPTLHRRVET